MVRTQAYIPEKGDIIYLDFSGKDQQGREQVGTRPALVLSPAKYNEKSNLVIACPITSQIKHYPFEVPLPENIKIHGVILVDQIKSLDWRARKASYISTIPPYYITEVLKKFNLIINFD
jgi:mRNA interferase MazF